MERPKLVTRVAHAGWEEHQFWGHEVFGQLLGQIDLAQLMALAGTGRLLEPQEAAVLTDLMISTTVADPRIWPLKIARVSGAYGSPWVALAAANLGQQGDRVGANTILGAAQGMREAVAALGPRAEDPQALRPLIEARLAQGRPLPGFGVPFRRRDERLVALEGAMERRGRGGLPFWRHSLALRAAVLELRGVEANVGLGLAAGLLDLGFAQDEISALAVALVQHNFYANAVEGAASAPSALRDLGPEWADYQGPGPRPSPRAAAKGLGPPVEGSEGAQTSPGER